MMTITMTETVMFNILLMLAITHNSHRMVSSGPRRMLNDGLPGTIHNWRIAMVWHNREGSVIGIAITTAHTAAINPTMLVMACTPKAALT